MLKWSKLHGQQWSGSTLPVYHDGKFKSCQILIQQNVFTVLPSQWFINPGMVLIFEVFLLRGALSPVDRAVAWGETWFLSQVSTFNKTDFFSLTSGFHLGCFPVCNRDFEIIKGKFKLPLLRGHTDHRITKHLTIEHLISSDIDHWIGNLYFEVTFIASARSINRWPVWRHRWSVCPDICQDKKNMRSSYSLHRSYSNIRIVCRNQKILLTENNFQIVERLTRSWVSEEACL